MKTRKALALILALTLFLALGSPTLAEGATAPTGVASADPHYSDSFTITYHSNSPARAANLIENPELTISSGSTGKVSVRAYASTSREVDQLGFTVLNVQGWSGSAWVTVASWTNQYDYDVDEISWSGSVTGCTSGGSYRATCTFYAMDGAQVNTASAITSYINCQ